MRIMENGDEEEQLFPGSTTLNTVNGTFRASAALIRDINEALGTAVTAVWCCIFLLGVKSAIEMIFFEWGGWIGLSLIPMWIGGSFALLFAVAQVGDGWRLAQEELLYPSTLTDALGKLGKEHGAWVEGVGRTELGFKVIGIVVTSPRVVSLGFSFLCAVALAFAGG